MSDNDRYGTAARTRPWLYISGPMRGKWGDSPWVNCYQGIKAAHLAYHAGWHPVCPMLNGFWEMVVGALDPTATDGAGGWMDYDISCLTRCDALLRLPGASEGADREVAVMEEQNKLSIILPEGCDLEEVGFPTPDQYLELVYDAWVRKWVAQ